MALGNDNKTPGISVQRCLEKKTSVSQTSLFQFDTEEIQNLCNVFFSLNQFHLEILFQCFGLK